MNYYRRLESVPPAEVRSWPIHIPTQRQLPDELRSAGDRLVHEADEILAGRVDILGSGAAEIGPEVDWHRDFKSGYRWPPDAFYQDIEVTRLDDRSDAKVVWDLSRCHHLLTLARASRLSGEDRYVRAVERQLTSWLDSNAVGRGINWVQPMEVALRAVNWVWTLRTLEGVPGLSSSLRRRLVTSLQAHGRHVAATLEGTPLLRSNHYLSDVLGLIVLGAVVSGDRHARSWLRVGRRGFNREVHTQVLDDGMSFESSVGYHGLVLEMFLLARHVATWRGVPLPPSYDERVARMLNASRVLRHPDGTMPLFGDVDSGRVLPASFARPASHDSLLALGAAILGLPRLVDGPPDPEVAWTVGVDAWERLASRPVASGTSDRSLPSAGFYVLERSGLRAVVRCGDVGQNGNGGHAHNDTGAYELFCGAQVAIDPGTYVYTADPDARNAFRSTTAHNTLMVDGTEINPIPKGLFTMPQFANPEVISGAPTGGASVTITHDGYRRLAGSPRHTRQLSISESGGTLTVTDVVDGIGAHRLECFVHLAPEVTVRQIRAGVYELSGSCERLLLSFSPQDVDVSLTSGWVAPEYGVRLRAPILSACWFGPLPGRMEHTFDRCGS